MSWQVIIGFVFTIVGAMLTMWEVKNKKIRPAIFSSIMTLAMLSMFAFKISPEELGHGIVPSKVEEFTKRLEIGVAYQLISTVKDAPYHVVLVKKADTSKFYALRVKEVPPEHFTLVDGKAIAIAQTAPLPATSYPPINKRGMGLW